MRGVIKVSIRDSDKRYMRRTYGFTGKLYTMWGVLCKFVKGLSLAITLFAIPVLLCTVLYYTFIQIRPLMVIACCVALWEVVDCNKKI